MNEDNSFFIVIKMSLQVKTFQIKINNKKSFNKNRYFYFVEIYNQIRSLLT